MIKQHYTGNSRRAMNLIWNTAQDYSWDCPFLAFFSDGTPDDYLNTVIGLSAKWLDRRRITDFFQRLGEGPTLDEASALLWLGIENCVYGKELAQRPVLADLRAERAKEFFRVSGRLSEQQMAFMSIRVYDQEMLRWSRVLGRRVLAVSPRAAALSRELEFSPEWDTEEVLLRMHAVLKASFRITLPDTPRMGTEWKKGLPGRIAGILSSKGKKDADLLLLRKGSGSGDAKRSVHISHDFGALPDRKDTSPDRAYMEEAFGPCMYTDAQMRILEKSLCRGNDAACRLWFSLADASFAQAGDARLRKPASKEAARLWADQEKQRRRNEEYWKAHLFQIRGNIRNLSAQLETVFLSWMNRLPERTRRGRLEGARAWRLPVAGDNRVFLRDGEAEESMVCVDLLLDASQSRMNAQEMIAAQALVISQSLEACKVPVRVTAFRSLRGYTVLQRLKEYEDRGGEGILGYYAGGWNRDALCLKAMRYILEEERKTEPFRTRILMVLTDASPNDSVRLAPKEGSLFSREYEGDEPVRDAEEAVRGLRGDGVYTCALFYGSASHLEQVHQIYGRQYARVKTLGQLPDAVCELLRRTLSMNRSR